MLSSLMLLAGLSWFTAGDAGPHSAVDAAHAAFIKGDYLTMTSMVRNALADPQVDEVVKGNMIDLLAAANRATGGQLPADWRMPPGILNLRFMQMRKSELEGVSYRFAVRGDTEKPDIVANLQLVRYPDEVLLDKQRSSDEWEVSPNNDKTYMFSLQTGRQSPLPEGLYIIKFEMRDGTASEGWFVLSDLAASTAPEIIKPAPSETLTTGNPEIVWRDYHSPEFKPYEKRRIAISMTKIEGDKIGWNTRWGLYKNAPEATRTVVGKDPDGEGDAELAPGRFWFSLDYTEQRRFGPLTLRRASRTGFPVYVRKP